MSNRPARITQAEIERAIRAAKKAGVIEVEVKIGDEVSIRIPLVPDNDIAKFGYREQSNATELDVWIAKHARETKGA
jgi:hypothetical protein